MQPQRDDTRDRELFHLLAGGHAAALGDIYDRHGAALFRHALAVTRNPADAEDLVQSTFVKLASAGPLLLGVRQPAGYLHRMLHAAWIDITRRRGVAGEETLARDMPARPEGDAEKWIDVQRALSTLPDSQREAIALHLFDGFSFSEIGRITGVSIFTAGSRYRLGLGRLRQLLGARTCPKICTE